MKAKTGATCLALAAMAGTIAAPLTARADSTQKQKNDWRNLAIGSGVIAGHGLLNHNSTEALIGAAGAAYSAKRYEDERKRQSQQQHRRSYYHRNEGTYVSGNRKYYWYQGHRYYQNLDTGARVMMY